MTADEIRTVRLWLGLSTEKFAKVVGADGGRNIRNWEAGDYKVPGPVEAIVKGMQANAHVRRYFLGRLDE